MLISNFKPDPVAPCIFTANIQEYKAGTNPEENRRNASSEARYRRLKSIKDFGWSEKIFFRKKGLDIQFGF